MDVEKTIEFILDRQARLQVLVGEIAAKHLEHEGLFAGQQRILDEREAIGRRTDARLDRAIRWAVMDARRERNRRPLLEQRANERMDRFEAGLEELRNTVQRYIDARGNGSNGR